VGSYVCPVDSDWALWFNWSMNISDIAVLTSVKGMNPITGQRIDGLGLEQYVHKCPIHKVEFKHGRYCPECDFKWPDQNYVSAPNSLYWDGFRSADGKVQQFYFTEDMSKSIPELVIGKDDTVPAFGFCFYTMKQTNESRFLKRVGNKLKNKFPTEAIVTSRFYGTGASGYSGGAGVSGYSGISGYKGCAGTPGIIRSKSAGSCGGGSFGLIGASFPGVYCSTLGSTDAAKSGSDIKLAATNSSDSLDSASAAYFSSSIDESEPVRGIGFGDRISLTSSSPVIMDSFSVDCERKSTAEIGIGAGQTISQGLQKDMRSVDQWKDKPAGIIRIYFVFREQFEKYAKSGFNDLTGCKSGYLEGLPVGGVK
jgi:hypothetical protein